MNSIASLGVLHYLLPFIKATNSINTCLVSTETRLPLHQKNARGVHAHLHFPVFIFAPTRLETFIKGKVCHTTTYQSGPLLMGLLGGIVCVGGRVLRLLVVAELTRRLVWLLRGRAHGLWANGALLRVWLLRVSGRGVLALRVLLLGGIGLDGIGPGGRSVLPRGLLLDGLVMRRCVGDGNTRLVLGLHLVVALG